MTTEQKTAFTADDVPTNGVVLTIESTSMGVWMLGDVDPNAETLAKSIYRLLSYVNCDSSKLHKAVIGITGRDN